MRISDWSSDVCSSDLSYLYPAAILGGTGYAPDATAMYLNGGNLALTPERAKTWSASIAFHPEALPRLEMELTGFDIDYTDRIVLPITSTSDMLTNPIYADFLTHYPTVEQQDRKSDVQGQSGSEGVDIG